VKYARVDLSEANAFVETIHRHHNVVPGHRFSVGAIKGGKLVGVAICGRPVARQTCKRTVLEVTRCCTDGTANACSFLYGVSSRIATMMGFAKIQTFIIDGEEDGTSLRASGWTFDGITKSSDDTKGWASRDWRDKTQPSGPKQRWIKWLNQAREERAA